MAFEVVQASAVIVDLLVVDLQNASEPVHRIHQLRHAFLVAAEQLLERAEPLVVLLAGVHVHVRPQLQGLCQSLQPLIDGHAISICHTPVA